MLRFPGRTNGHSPSLPAPTVPGNPGDIPRFFPRSRIIFNENPRFFRKETEIIPDVNPRFFSKRGIIPDENPSFFGRYNVIDWARLSKFFLDNHLAEIK